MATSYEGLVGVYFWFIFFAKKMSLSNRVTECECYWLPLQGFGPVSNLCMTLVQWVFLGNDRLPFWTSPVHSCTYCKVDANRDNWLQEARKCLDRLKFQDAIIHVLFFLLCFLLCALWHPCKVCSSVTHQPLKSLWHRSTSVLSVCVSFWDRVVAFPMLLPI